MPSQKDNRNEFADQAASENENDRQAPLEESQALDIDAVSELSGGDRAASVPGGRGGAGAFQMAAGGRGAGGCP